MIFDRLIWMALLIFIYSTNGQETGLPDYVVSECYGDIFNFDCGAGNKIRINRDFFGYSQEQSCRYNPGDCIISNPKSNSLIHRYCTGHRVCTYYLVERRGCGGAYSNYQQVEYQCIPDTKITNICETAHYETTSTYIASPNFPENYPPNVDCRCIVSSTDPDSKVQLEVVYLAVKYTWPCKDWLQIGRRRTCGTNVDLYQGRTIPILFHSDKDESHSGFWLHFQSSGKDSKILIRCGNATLTPPPPVTRKPPTPPTQEPNTTTESTTTEADQTQPTTLPVPGEEERQEPVISDDKDTRSGEDDNIPSEYKAENNKDEEIERKDRVSVNEKPADPNNDGASIQPTVPPNLPFGDIRRPENKITPNIIDDANGNDDKNRNNPTDIPDFNTDGGSENKDDYNTERTRENKDHIDSNLVPSPVQTEGTYPPSFPFSPSDGSKDLNQLPTVVKNDNIDSDSPDSKVSLLEDTTASPIEHYPAHDIAEGTTVTTTTSTTTTTFSRVLAEDPLKDPGDLQKDEHLDKTFGSKMDPSFDLKPDENFERNEDRKHQSISNANSEDQDRTTPMNRDGNTSENIIEPADTHGETKQPNKSTKYEYDPTEQIMDHPRVPPPDNHHDETSKPDSNQDTIVPFPLDEYDDQYNYIEDFEPEDNIQIPVDNIDKGNEESGTAGNVIVHGRETGQNVLDITRIHSVHDVKGHPVDLNTPEGTGGNSTFNTTAKNTTVITKAAKEEDGGIITLGLIILCICIGVGILLVVCVLLAIYCRRRRHTRDDETQTSGGNTKAKKTIVVVGVDQDGDSGQGLLVIGNGHVHGTGRDRNHSRRKNIVGPIEHPVYTRPKRADKSMQIDFDSEYNDVMIYNRDYTLEDIDSEVSSIHSSSSPLNHKSVQVRPNGHGRHGRLSMSPGRHNRPMSPGRPPRPMSPMRHNTSQPLKRSHGIDDIAYQINQKPLPPRRTTGRHSVEPVERSPSVGIDVNYMINDIHVEPTHGYNAQRRKHSMYGVSDSEVDSFTGSDTDTDKIKKESLASMSELAEMTMAPENTMDSKHLDFTSDSDGSDWDQRSAISI